MMMASRVLVVFFILRTYSIPTQVRQVHVGNSPAKSAGGSSKNFPSGGDYLVRPLVFLVQ